MAISGINMGKVKNSNRTAILRYMNYYGPVSRKDIAGATGLTPAAVTQICGSMMLDHMILETGDLISGAGAGRKKVLLDINWNYRFLLGLVIEPEETVVSLCNMRGNLVSYRKLETDTSISPENFLKKLADECREIISFNDSFAQKIDAVSVCITGLVDKEAGVSLKAYGIWDQPVNVVDILQKELSLPVIIENNVTAFSIAENYFGWGKDYENLLLIKWGPGIGGTIIIDGEVYEGRHGRAAEIGHVIVDDAGEKCSCGKYGCLETKASYYALNKIIKFNQDDFEGILDVQNRDIRAQIDSAVDLFARTLVNAATVLAPNRVVLFGPFFQSQKAREKLLKAVARYDKELSANRILYTALSDIEEYIGPVASYVEKRVFN